MLSLLLACSAPDDTATAPDPTTDGAYGVGHRTVLLDDSARPLTVSVWYPADADPTERAVADAYLTGSQQDDYTALLAIASPDCPSQTTHAAEDAPLADGGPWPAVVLSHCHSCTRFSTFTLAQRLASHGIVVAAPDHAGNTLFDHLIGESLSISTDTLALRQDDTQRTLQALLDGVLGIDEIGSVGAAGHSFGSVTAGALTQADRRIVAAMGIAAPMETPFPSGVEIAALEVPLLFVIAEEDNSITEVGNDLIRSNFEAATNPAFLAELADAGHWSPSDLCGIIEDFLPGCGEGSRQTSGEPFTYLPAARGRDLVSTLGAAFFLETLAGEAGLLESVALPEVVLTTQ